VLPDHRLEPTPDLGVGLIPGFVFARPARELTLSLK